MRDKARPPDVTAAARTRGSRKGLQKDVTGEATPNDTPDGPENPPERRRFLILAFSIGLLRPERLRDAVVRDIEGRSHA